MKQKILVDDEECDKKKKKNIALKVTNIKNIESHDAGCQRKSNKNMKLMFQKFKEFLRHKNKVQSSRSKVKKDRHSLLHAMNEKIKGI